MTFTNIGDKEEELLEKHVIDKEVMATDNATNNTFVLTKNISLLTTGRKREIS